MNLFRFASAAALLCTLAAPASAQELYGTLKKVRDSKVLSLIHI